MNWFFIALLAPALWSVTNHIDKYVVSKYFKGGSVGAAILFTCFISVLFIPLAFLFDKNIFSIPSKYIILIVFNGSLYVLGLLPYIIALNKDEASIVVPLFQTIPVFTYILGYIFLRETLTPIQLLGSLLIIIGAVGISLEIGGKKVRLKKEVLLLMFLASFLVALNGLIFKFVAISTTFWVTSFWEYVGFLVLGIIILTFVKSYRNSFIKVLKTNKLTILGISSVNEIINISAKISLNFASTLAPLTLVWDVNGFQPFFVFVYGIILTLFFPKISTEKLNRHILIQKILAICVMFAGTYLINK